MAKIVVYMSMSVDGFIAGPDDDREHGLGVGGEVLHEWLTDGGAHPEAHRPGSGVNRAVFDEMMATGAVITGRRTFEHGGEWADHHDGVPIYVLTRTPAETHGLVHRTSDLRHAVEAAKQAAGARDVMMHGASATRALLDAGLVDEFAIHLVPVLLGRGRRLFDDPEQARRLRLVTARQGDGVLHLRYGVDGADPTVLRS